MKARHEEDRLQMPIVAKSSVPSAMKSLRLAKKLKPLAYVDEVAGRRQFTFDEKKILRWTGDDDSSASYLLYDM